MVLVQRILQSPRFKCIQRGMDQENKSPVAESYPDTRLHDEEGVYGDLRAVKRLREQVQRQYHRVGTPKFNTSHMWALSSLRWLA